MRVIVKDAGYDLAECVREALRLFFDYSVLGITQ
jgi:hypothetical protein